jgi:hypothetical protein
MGGGRFEDLGDDLTMVAEPEFDVEQVLGRREPGGFEPLAEGNLDVVGQAAAQYRSAPQAQRPAE